MSIPADMTDDELNAAVAQIRTTLRSGLRKESSDGQSVEFDPESMRQELVPLEQEQQRRGLVDNAPLPGVFRMGARR